MIAANGQGFVKAGYLKTAALLTDTVDYCFIV